MRALLALLLTGCTAFYPAPAPMHFIADNAATGKQARCLLVLLPGRGDSDEVFADHGFIKALRKRNLSVDTISANATFGYYMRNTVRDRIDQDILAGKHYEQLWFAGVSMGGTGSLMMAQRRKDITGIILIAPFLGEDEVIDEVANAGGIAKWQPPPNLPDSDYQRGMWVWLKRATEHPDAAPSVYLASGDQDRLAAGHRLLGPALQPGHRFRIHGGHDWGPWAELWADFLDHSDFASRCGTR